MTETQSVHVVSKNPIVRKIAEGTATEEVLGMLMKGQLPFTEEEKLESLVFIMKNDRHRTQVLEQLKTISEATKVTYVDKLEANHRVAFYVLLEALNWKKVSIIAKIVKNQALPYEFLLKIAQKGDEAMLEMLLDNQIKMIAYPEIMDAMDKNPANTNFVRGRVKAIRDYYLVKENAEEIKAEEVMDDLKESLSQELAASDGENSDEDMEDLEDLEVVEEKALSALQEINNMSISERVKLALGGTKTHRMILIKDPNKMVAMAVMESPKLSPDEVVLLVKNKSIAGEIIAKISVNREWTKKYPIILELVQNPKTPIKHALGFIKKLHIRDLRQVTKSKNVNPVIRNLAMNFYDQKTGVKK